MGQTEAVEWVGRQRAYGAGRVGQRCGCIQGPALDWVCESWVPELQDGSLTWRSQLDPEVGSLMGSLLNTTCQIVLGPSYT